jgi:aldehyde dehydrogenase
VWPGAIKVVRVVKDLCEARAEEWGRLELEETRIGRLDHKIEKLKGQRACRGSSS